MGGTEVVSEIFRFSQLFSDDQEHLGVKLLQPAVEFSDSGDPGADDQSAKV